METRATQRRRRRPLTTLRLKVSAEFRTKPNGDTRPPVQLRSGRRLCLRLLGRRVQQPRSVTWLLRCLCSLRRCSVVKSARTNLLTRGPSFSSWRGRRRRRRSRRRSWGWRRTRRRRGGTWTSGQRGERGRRGGRRKCRSLPLVPHPALGNLDTISYEPFVSPQSCSVSVCCLRCSLLCYLVPQRRRLWIISLFFLEVCPRILRARVLARVVRTWKLDIFLRALVSGCSVVFVLDYSGIRLPEPCPYSGLLGSTVETVQATVFGGFRLAHSQRDRGLWIPRPILWISRAFHQNIIPAVPSCPPVDLRSCVSHGAFAQFHTLST